MAKVNVSADEYCNLTICFLLDKMLHPDEVCFMNEEFNEYANKLTGKGMKPLSLNSYLRMDPNIRVYYKRIKRIFSYDSNESMVIQIWPSEKTKEEMQKKDNIVKRVIKKLLMRESINREEEQLLKETIGDENR
jgi:hypothetical protein